MDLEQILSIHKCGCGRSYCDFFSSEIGEYGSSFSKKDIKKLIKEEEKRDSEKIIKYLKSLLK